MLLITARPWIFWLLIFTAHWCIYLLQIIYYVLWLGKLKCWKNFFSTTFVIENHIKIKKKIGENILFRFGEGRHYIFEESREITTFFHSKPNNWRYQCQNNIWLLPSYCLTPIGLFERSCLLETFGHHLQQVYYNTQFFFYGSIRLLAICILNAQQMLAKIIFRNTADDCNMSNRHALARN